MLRLTGQGPLKIILLRLLIFEMETLRAREHKRAGSPGVSGVDLGLDSKAKLTGPQHMPGSPSSPLQPQPYLAAPTAISAVEGAVEKSLSD